jgi:hypothetical protein
MIQYFGGIRVRRNRILGGAGLRDLPQAVPVPFVPRKLLPLLRADASQQLLRIGDHWVHPVVVFVDVIVHEVLHRKIRLNRDRVRIHKTAHGLALKHGLHEHPMIRGCGDPSQEHSQ